MRIALVSETFLPQINGVSRTLDRLTRFLLARGDEVLLLIPRYPDKPPAPSSPPPRDPDALQRVTFAAFPLPLYPEVMVCVGWPGKIRRALARFCPDVVHIATEGPPGLAALRACRRLRIPVVSSYHTNFAQYARFYRCGLIEPGLWAYLRWFHNRTRRTLCPSPSIQRLLETKGFRNVAVWRRGIDTRLFDPARRSDALRARYGLGPDTVALIYVGRLASEKNIQTLIEAARALPAPCHNGAGVRLLLVGDGPFRPELEKAGDERIVFAGYQRGEDLAAHYASADLMVFPSLTETFGNVVLEAMASGLPVVGFNAPGPADIIQPGLTGLIAEDFTPGALTRQIEAFLRDPDLRRQCGARARAYALTQDWDSINAVVAEAYAAAIAAHALETASSPAGPVRA